MADRFQGYVQTNILPVNNPAVFGAELHTIECAQPSDFMDLYTILSERSHQAQMIGDVLLRAVEKVEKIAVGKIWLPDRVSCLTVGPEDIELTERGVTLVAFQESPSAITKKQAGITATLLPHTLGFVLNTAESPNAQLRSAQRWRPLQRLLQVSGRLINR